MQIESDNKKMDGEKSKENDNTMSRDSRFFFFETLDKHSIYISPHLTLWTRFTDMPTIS